LEKINVLLTVGRELENIGFSKKSKGNDCQNEGKSEYSNNELNLNDFFYFPYRFEYFVFDENIGVRAQRVLILFYSRHFKFVL